MLNHAFHNSTEKNTSSKWAHRSGESPKHRPPPTSPMSHLISESTYWVDPGRSPYATCGL